MLVSIEKAREIRNRLRNPPNGIMSDETEIVSAPVLRRRRLDALIREEERSLEDLNQKRWAEIKERLQAEKDKAAAELENQERTLREQGVLTAEMILRIVCAWFSISRIEITSPRRSSTAVYPRHIAMYLCRRHTTLSLPQIGAKMGGRDHTTVLHAINKLDALINSGDPKICSDIDRLRKVLGVT